MKRTIPLIFLKNDLWFAWIRWSVAFHQRRFIVMKTVQYGGAVSWLLDIVLVPFINMRTYQISCLFKLLHMLRSYWYIVWSLLILKGPLPYTVRLFVLAVNGDFFQSDEYERGREIYQIIVRQIFWVFFISLLTNCWEISRIPTNQTQNDKNNNNNNHHHHHSCL